MTTNPTPEFAALVIACAAAIHQQLYQLIELQSLEVQILKKLYGKQVRPTDPDKRRLAVQAQAISRQVLEMTEHIVTVDSFRRWHRTLIAKTYTGHRRGRPRIAKEVEALILRLAKENPSWGEDSIADRMAELGHQVSDRTVSNVLRRNGIPPAPEREKTNDWERFITAQWPDIAAIDFATFEVPADDGTHTVRNHALYAIHLQTREVQLVGVTDNANGAWMANMGRKLADMCDGFLLNKKYCLMDRDPLFTEQFQTCLRSIGCEPKILPPRSPDLNAHIERFVGTVRREIGRKVIPFSTESLEHMLRVHCIYYNQERNHQALAGHRIPCREPHDNSSTVDGEVKCRSRLGKTLNYYWREAG